MLCGSNIYMEEKEVERITSSSKWKMFFPSENHEWKTNSSLLIFHITILWIKFTFRMEIPSTTVLVFTPQKFIGIDFYSDSFPSTLLILPFSFGEKLVVLSKIDRKRETEKQQSLTSQKFFPPTSTRTCFRVLRTEEKTTNLDRFMVIF